MIAALTQRMIKYYGADPHLTNHALKVAAYAALIADREGCDHNTATLVTLSAILHDIGIPNAKRVHGSAGGKYQEIEGPPVARELMTGLGIAQDVSDRVCFLIGHHHTYGAIDGTDFQILVEADFIVNAFEGKLGPDAIASMKRNLFKTRTGTDLLDTLYPPTTADRAS